MINDQAASGAFLDHLYQKLETRKQSPTADSFSAKLLQQGNHKVAQKLGEEAVEVVIEALRQDHERLIYESADLLYFLTLLWVGCGVKPEEVWAELARREMPKDLSTPAIILKNQYQFTSRSALATQLATAIATELRQALVNQPRVSLAVSGGRTPDLLFAQLAQQPLDWSRVTILLVDERWVPESSDRSNTATVRRGLLQGLARDADYFPLYDDNFATPTAAIASLAEQFNQRVPLPLCVTVMGMGLDGHTASWFPNGDNLSAALSPLQTAPLLSMQAEAAGETRITLTLPIVAASKTVFIHIEGEEKCQLMQQILAKQLDAISLPMTQFLMTSGDKTTIYSMGD